MVLKYSNLLKIIIRQILNNENATFKDLHEFNPDLKFLVQLIYLLKNMNIFLMKQHQICLFILQ